MMFVCLGPQANFFDLNFRLRFPGFLLFFCTFIKKFADVGNFANGRGGARGDFYQVEFRFPSLTQCFFYRYNADIFAFGIDQADFRNTNGFICSEIDSADSFLLIL
jgi:hypothetical protein